VALEEDGLAHAVGVPHPRRLVGRRRRHALAVGAPRSVVDAARVAAEHDGLALARRVPDASGPVERGGQDARALGARGDEDHRALVTLEDHRGSGAARAPQARCPVSRGAEDALAVRMEDHAGERPGVALELDHPAAVGAPHPRDGVPVRRDDDARGVGTPGRRDDGELLDLVEVEEQEARRPASRALRRLHEASPSARSAGTSPMPSWEYTAFASKREGSSPSGHPSMRTHRIPLDAISAGMTAACISDDLPAPDGPYTVTQRLATTLPSSRAAMSSRPKKRSRSAARYGCGPGKGFSITAWFATIPRGRPTSQGWGSPR
jgi:hypothetical protein